MRIIFVRHGHPNYRNDCLTELGHIQAEALADRLSCEEIDYFASSSCGRAYETAMHVAERLGKEVEKLDFMREIPWGDIEGKETPSNNSPWYCVADMIKDKESIVSPEWDRSEYFARNKATFHFPKISAQFDEWLARLGYEREGEYYRVKRKNDSTVLLASHGGASGSVLSHLFNLPLPFVFATFRINYTSVTIVSLDGDEGEIASPQIEIMNDARHIEGITEDNIYGR